MRPPGRAPTATIMERPARKSGRRVIAAQIALVVLLLARLDRPPARALAVSVQRLQVPDLVVIDQQAAHGPRAHQQPVQPLAADNSSRTAAAAGSLWPQTRHDRPTAASLTTGEPQQQQITFECLVGFDRRRDKNLIVKWHHDERTEPIYQWIPELNKRSVAPQYRNFIAPIAGQPQPAGNATDWAAGNATHQLVEAGFRLIRPTKELGGKYTCSAISSQNDDSKSKKMIVYAPPRSFRFNATRADIGALLASQRDRLIQMTQPAHQQPAAGQLPLVYRMRGLEGAPAPPATTISPRMYSTIDYVNVNQQRARQQLADPQLQRSSLLPPHQHQHQHQHQQQQVAAGRNSSRPAPARSQQLGVKLVCDIDQVFPVPEVSIYRLARPDGSHPEKLAKLDTRIERDVHTGLFHVQVISILDDDELQILGRGGAGPEPGAEVYFECLIALTNLELSRYADNKRSIIYRPGQQAAGGLQVGAHYQQQQRDFSITDPFRSAAGRSCAGPRWTALQLAGAGLAAALALLA